MSDRPKTRRRAWGIVIAIVALLVIANIAIRLHVRRQDAEIGKGLFVPAPAKMTPEVALLQQYLRIDTTNPPGNEIAGARFLSEKLREHGIPHEVIESAPGRGNVYARIAGKQKGTGLLLLHHIDVVPAQGKWTRPPFSGGIAINMIHGRGAIDMKGVGITHLQAFIDVARSERKPEHDIIFLATADEEQGGVFGVQWLLANRPELFEGVRYALNEGGLTEMQRETLSYFAIETGAKQTTVLDLVGPDRDSLRAARQALEPFFEPRDPDRVLPGVRRYFQAVSKTRVEVRETLTDIDETLRRGKFWLVPEAYRNLIANTLRVYGPARDPSGAWSMRAYLLNLPDEDPDARLRWLEAKVAPFGVKVGKIHHKQGPAPISDDQTPLFALIQAEAKRAYNGVPAGPMILGLVTNDSRFLRAKGITCYGVQPFRVDFFQSHGVHGVDERLRLDWFGEGVEFMRRIVAGYAFPASDTN